MKQSSHMWYCTFKDFVILIGFVASRVNGGLFVLDVKEDHSIVVTAVVLFVDHLVVIANEGLIGEIKDQIRKSFRRDDIGSIACDLGINIEGNREHDTIDIHQQSSICTFLAKFRKDESRPGATPRVMRL
jgi:hypothetical protein